MMRAIAALLILSMVGACALPRGAALRSEVLDGATSKDAPFEVVPVTRINLAKIEKWPQTGPRLSHVWPQGRRGSLSYRIQQGDQLSMTVWDNQENSLLTTVGQKQAKVENLVVSPSGNVFVPYVGEVYVKGQTMESARSTIAAKMTDIVPSAQIQLSVMRGQGSTVRAVAGVAAPGSYVLPDGNYSVLNLLSDAGGVRGDLENPAVRLLRGNQTFEIYVDTLIADGSRDVVLRGGDKIVVQDLPQTFIALGATSNQQLVRITNPPVTALEAISLAGGLSEGRANPKGVMVLREYPREAVRIDTHGPSKDAVIFTMDLTSADGLFAARNLEIFPNDIVYASESPVPSLNAALNLFRLGSSSATTAVRLR